MHYYFALFNENINGKRNIICLNYVSGFCPKGPKCEKVHLKSVIIDEVSSLKELANFPDSLNYKSTTPDSGFKVPFNKYSQKPTICHHCGQEGHKSTYCNEEQISPQDLKLILGNSSFHVNEKVMCFNCT